MVVYASMFDVDGADWPKDDPFPAIPGPNQVLADDMGIVMGTSHHEPMARNKPEWDRAQEGPWDWTNSEVLEKFWKTGAERAKGRETLFTMGMRGDGDMPLTGASNELVQSRLVVMEETDPRYHCCSASDFERCIRNRRYIINTSDVGNVQGSRRVLSTWR
jgi:hypothetical protein